MSDTRVVLTSREIQNAYLIVGAREGDPAATCLCGCGVLWHFAPADPCCRAPKPPCPKFRWRGPQS